MMRQGHRNAVRLLLGGAVTAALGGASLAYACTPTAVTTALFASVPRDAAPEGETVTITGYGYSNEIINGAQYRDLDQPGPQFAPVEVQIREIVGGMEPADVGRPAKAATDPLVKTASGPAYTMDLKLAGPGYYPFVAYAVNKDGILVRPTTFTYRVIAAGARTETQPPPGAELVTPAPPQFNTVPADAPGTATPPVVPATPPPGQVTPKPAPAPAAKPTAVAKPAAATAPRSSATPAAVPAARTSAGAQVAPALAVPTPVSEAEALAPLPAQTNLWSGLDPSAGTPSLTSGPTTPSGGGIPVGGALLGIGVLGLAGVAAVTGRRKVALAKTSRS